MKNAKELKEYYINLLLNYCTESEYKSELIRLKNIAGCLPKPKMSKEEENFINFINKNIYSGNTTNDLLFKRYGIKNDKNSANKAIEIFGSIENGQIIYNDLCKEAKTLIENNFIKFESELNNLLP